MESKREKRARLFLELSGGLIGARQFADHFIKKYYMNVYDDVLDVKEALVLADDIDKDNIILNSAFKVVSAAAKAQEEFLDNYLDYLKETVREEKE